MDRRLVMPGIAVAIALAGCASMSSTPAAGTGGDGSPAASAAATVSAPPSGCSSQVISWRGNGGTHDIDAVASDEDKIIATGKALAAAINSGTGMSSAESGLQTAAASLEADAEAAESDPPPGCVPGLRADWRAAMTDYAKAALSYQNAVSELSSGQDTTAVGDLDAGNASADKASGKLTSAAGDLQRYER